jgi:hypothetical protein
MKPLIYKLRFLLILRVLVTFFILTINCVIYGEISLSKSEPIVFSNPLKDKNFYFLTLLANNEMLSNRFKSNKTLNLISHAKFEAAKRAVSLSIDSKDSLLTGIFFSDAEIRSIQDALVDELNKNKEFEELLEGQFSKSRFFYRYEKLTNEEKIKHAWTDCANGINYILRTYGLGQKPLYPIIDSARYDVKSSDFKNILRLQLLTETNQNESKLFFETPLNIALGLLDINNRDEPSRFEPMELGVNHDAFVQVDSTLWQQYAYSAIVVPGAGPGTRDIPLSALGKIRLQLAYKRYMHHDAPFIIVSGGYVHPAQTPYCEAFEMRSYLIDNLHVSKSAIIIEPHARHTTTNLRNTARLIYRYSIPFDKPVLIVSDPLQSSAIQGETFRKRCINEMHCVPYKNTKRISPFDTELYFTLDALHYDNVDPLDP